MFVGFNVMLQTLNEKMQGWPAIIVLGIATFAMAFFGMEGYFASHADTYVAKIGKTEISQQQFRDRMNNMRQRAMAKQGDGFDGSAFDSITNKRRILDVMIDQTLLRQASHALGMRVPNQSLRQAIANVPLFQVNGRFDADTYRAVLASRGMTPTLFEQRQRANMAVTLLPKAIAGTALITDADVDRYLQLQRQQRDIRYVIVSRPDKLPGKTVSKAEIANYYQAHLADFMQPEKVALQYIEISDLDIPSRTIPDENQLRQRYEQEKSRFVKPEMRQVSDILIALSKNASLAQKKSALAKAEHISARATAANFATLAKKYSDDLGSRKHGGDLGWVARGLADSAFDHTLFGLKQGQISSPVLASDGYHIIYLRNIRRGKIKTFKAARAELEREAAKAIRARQFNDLAGRLTDATYQTPTSLDAAASSLKLPIRYTRLFSRHGGTDIAANPKVIKAAFSDDVLAQGNNSSLINLGRDDAVVVRIDKHVPKAAKPLAQVSNTIKQIIVHNHLLAVARKRAHALLLRLRKGKTMAALARARGMTVHSVKALKRIAAAYSGKKDKGTLVPAVLRREAFLLPHPVKGKSQYAAVSLGAGAFALLAVDRVHTGDLSAITATERAQERLVLAQSYGSVSVQGFLDMLKANTKIKIDEDRL